MRSIRFPTTALARVTTVVVAANMCVSLGGAMVSGSRPAGRDWRESRPRVMQPAQHSDRSVGCLGNLPCQTIQY